MTISQQLFQGVATYIAKMIMILIFPFFTFFFILGRSQSTSVEVRPTPYHTLSWLGPPCATRTHKNTFSRLGLDEEHAKQVIKQACLLIAF